MTQPPTRQPGLPPEGWYPNPDNPEQERWWDGQAWTEHVAVGAPLAPGAVPHVPGQQPIPPSSPQQPQPVVEQPYLRQPAAQQPPAQQPYLQQPQAYPYQQPPHGYAPYAPHGYGAPSTPVRGVLPDGSRVAGWWWRVLARFIDGILVWVPASIIGAGQIHRIFTIFRDYMNQVQAATNAGTPVPSFDVINNSDYLRAATLLALIYALAWIVYEAVMLKVCAATVGKLVCGLRVRPWSQPGPLGWGVVARRVLAYQVAYAVPTVGPLYVLVDVLWPLWDHDRQALHDKVASTAVVKVREQAAPGR
jgi:uncharacterized RDD family membrane protein YckC